MKSTRCQSILIRRPGVLVALLSAVFTVACGRGHPEDVQGISRAVAITSWAPGVSYVVGALVTFNGISFRCRQAHTSQVGWEPPNVPALWERPGAAGISPWANQTAYVLGSGVTFDGLVYRCIQAHTSQPDWTPPAVPTLWKVTGDVQIPPGLTGSLAFVFKSRNLPANIVDGFGLVQRDPFGDPVFTELLDSKQKSVGEIFHRVQVKGGEIFEFYLQANKTQAASTPSMTVATYSSDPTMNNGIDPTKPDHVAQPLQDATQKANHIWSLRWESFNFADSGRDGKFNDLTVELRLEAPCDNVTIVCPDPNLVVSSHGSSQVDYRGDLSVPAAGSLIGVPVGPLRDPTGGEGDPTPLGIAAFPGARVDTLRWSFVQESTDFSTATPLEATSLAQCNVPSAALLNGGLWSLQVKRLHRPRGEALVSSYGPGVFSNFDAKLALRPSGIGNQNTVQLFDPESDAPPTTFFELSLQDGDNATDGRYHDNGTRAFSSLVLFNGAGSVEANILNATQAVATRQTGEQIKFEIIRVQGTGATQREGRVIAFLDRNGNATTATYQFAANSTDTQLGGDRKKLWLINRATDPHGVGATFNYTLRSGTSRWVVTAIAMPNGTTTQYQYGTDTANLDRLTAVVHANGDTSSFSRAWDAASQSWALGFRDAVGGDVRPWKTVYVTGTTFTTSDSVVHSQEPNLVRRIVNNNGEQAYLAREDPNDRNTTFFREGANKITRLKLDSNGVPREVASATTVSPDPLSATYAVVESYTGDVVGMIQKATDGFGNTRSFVRDSKTRGILSVSARGGTTASFILNSFLEPTQTLDRLNRKTTISYDAKGNPLTITHAAGTGIQAAWAYVNSTKGQVTQVTDANGKATNYSYGATTSFLQSITEPPDVTGGSRPVRTFSFDSAGRLSSCTDQGGRSVSFAYDNRGRLTTTTFPDVSTETLAYGSGATAGLVGTKTDRNGVVEKYEYDSTRRLVKTTHGFGGLAPLSVSVEYLAGTELPSAQVSRGERVELTYDERQRPTARKVFKNGTASLVYQKAWDNLGRNASDTDPYGRRVLRVFDVNGRISRTVTESVPGGVPAGVDLTTLPRVATPNPPYTIEDPIYDAMNQYTSTTDARGFVTNITLDEQGRRTSVVRAPGRPEQRRTTFAYDVAGNLTTQTESRTFTEGQTFQTVFTYTGRNQVKTKTEAAATADAATVSYTYTATGKTATTTDARGGVTTNSYDACCDRLASVRDPAGFTTSYGYDALGNRTSVTNPLGATTTCSYDSSNRKIRETNPLGQATQYVYDDDLTDGVGLDATYSSFIAPLGFGAGANGSAVEITNAAGERRVTIGDGSGRTIREINAALHATTTTYDLVVSGLVETSVTDNVGNVTRSDADTSGRVRIFLDGAGKATTRTFDPAGNLLSVRDSNGLGQDCQYDALEQLTSCTDTRGDATTYTYDAAGNQIGVTDGAGIHTSCAFDFRNRKKSCTDGVGGVTLYAYDGNSNATRLTDAQGGVTTYSYDARNLRITETFPDSSGPTDHVTKTYDGAGRLGTRVDQSGNTMTYTYDSADRLIQKTDPQGKIDSFIVDAIGRLTGGSSQRYGTTIGRTYDGAGRLSAEALILDATGESHAVAYGYDANDRQASLTYPDGTVVSRTYTNRDQLSTITLGTRSLVTYIYDDAGRQTTSTFGNGLVETRAYRADDRLAAISTPVVGDLSYTYDGAKRKVTEGGTAVNGTQSFTYDNAGRVTNWNNGADTQSWALSLVGDWQSTTRSSVTENRTHNAAHEVTAVNGIPLNYDARGNLVTDDLGHTLTWDFEDRLSATQGVGYLYDVLGRRVGRLEDGPTTLFVHAGNEVVAEFTDGDLTIKYILGPTIDRPVAFVGGAILRWYSANHLGSIAAVTDGGGAVVERYRYDAYGARTILSAGGTVQSFSTVGNQVGFTGRYHDATSGLIDLRARQYSPRLGRFVSRDDQYRDGMLLYGAYFVPNGTDPMGAFSLSGAWHSIKKAATVVGAVVAPVATFATGTVINGAVGLVTSPGDIVDDVKGVVARTGDRALEFAKTAVAATGWVATHVPIDPITTGVSAYKWLTSDNPGREFETGLSRTWKATVATTRFAVGTALEVPTLGPTSQISTFATAIGLGIVAFNEVFTGNIEIPNVGWTLQGPYLEFWRQTALATGTERGFTLGRVVIYGAEADAETRRHERQHVIQANVLGDAYLPVIAYTYAVGGGERGWPLEGPAYMHRPWPF